MSRKKREAIELGLNRTSQEVETIKLFYKNNMFNMIKVTHIFILFLVLIGLCTVQASAQNNLAGAKKIALDDFGGLDDINGDGRFVVFNSRSSYSTVNNRNNSDGNSEIFLFDYAQRQVFQITNTKNLLHNPQGSPTGNNIKLEMLSYNARISNDGKYIVIVSNATTSSPTNPNLTNPGNFDANSFTDSQGNNPLMQDGNTEIWLYTLPNYASVDISTGIIPPFVDLSNGTFKQITNTKGDSQELGFLKFHNNHPVINDNGCVLAFVSNRKLVVGRNNDETPEAFTWVNNDTRCSNLPIGNGISQVTEIPRLGFLTFVNSLHISGDGRRLAFMSNTNNPVIDMVGGTNSDFSGEVFFTDLNEVGEPDGIKRQVTDTTEPNPEITVILFSIYGKRLSRDGRYILFDSLKNMDSSGQGQGTTLNSHALYLYDSLATTQKVKQIGPRSQDDAVLTTTNPDVFRFSTFTDYNANSAPQTIVFNSRINMTTSGSIPITPTEGLNPNTIRQAQIYSTLITSETPVFNRLTNPTTTDYAPCRIGGNPFFGVFAECERAPLVSNSINRMIFGQLLNASVSDNKKDFVYLLNKNTTSIVPENEFSLTYSTGASDMTITGEAIGLSPNMLGSLRITSSQLPTVNNLNATDVSRKRNFSAPIELNNVSISIDGFSAQLTAVHQGRIDFITPTEVSEGLKPIVINHTGKVFKGTVNIIKNQPDVVTIQQCPCASGGRTKILNITDPNNPMTEPFSTMTWTPTGGLPTKLRVFVTGVKGVAANQLSIKVGSITLSQSSILTNAVEDDYPGVYTFDFLLPSELAGAGDIPIVVTTNTGQTVSSRPESSASKFRVNAVFPTDLAVWRPTNGGWYVMGGSGVMQAAAQWGLGTDFPAPGDYDGDGKTDFCVFRPSDGAWYVLKSSDNSFTAYQFGTNGDKVAQSDYDGDGKVDYAVFRPSTSNWYVLQSTNGQMLGAQFGLSTDELVPADYDGDGKADWAIWRASDAQFWVRKSSDNQIFGVSFGQSGDKPVVGDYDGDGKYDFATWRGSDNIWRIFQSSNNQQVDINWGLQNIDVAVQGDYDSDGKTDIAVWRSGWWYIRKSRDGQLRSDFWGQAGDIPVPAPYRRY